MPKTTPKKATAAKPTTSAKASAAAQTHAFQTEVQQLLHLIIHSLYSNKEIFLRELVSNASDACDRLRFLALTDKKLENLSDELKVRVTADPKAKTIRVLDNGIGMNRAEVMENIGTIARSGTRNFVQQMSEKDAKDSALIGQFGVGFYSAFLVAKRVTLLTRRADGTAKDGVKWVSDGSGEYSIENLERAQHGTEIILELHPDQAEFLESYRLRTLINKYANHISLPIEMPQSDDAAADSDAKDGDGWEVVNGGTALWAKPKKDISAEQHNNFYTSLSYDPEPPAVILHNRVEGKLEYISLFYIPAKAPFDLWDRERRHGIKLYVRRVFISDDAKQLLPNYLRFVRGLVDSADLPLNVSREFLQSNKDIDTIRASSVKKILAELKKIAASDADKYQALWKEYGRVIKEGVIEDQDNRAEILNLLRFASTHAGDESQTVSFADYLSRMPKTQTAIYYLTAENYASASASPHLEVFRKNEVEVLLLCDAVDEWVVGSVSEHEGKPLRSIAKGDLDLGEISGATQSAEKDKTEPDSPELQPLLEKIKTVLAGQVKEVRLSERLVDSPACLVADSHDLGGNLERILKAVGQDAPTAKPILEINPHHAMVCQIAPDGELADEWAQVLFDHALLAEGAALKDPGAYVKRIHTLLGAATTESPPANKKSKNTGSKSTG